MTGRTNTNGMEPHWALLKRGITGTFHHISAKHLSRYTTEFEGRHNNRPLDTTEQMSVMARGAGGKQLPYATLSGPPATRNPRMF